jgi:uncharacterized repeat protein (TIGR01451 family)
MRISNTLPDSWPVARGTNGVSPRLLVLLLVPVLLLLCFACSAGAETPGAGWELTSTLFPTNIAPAGGTGTLEVDVFNVGAAPSEGPVTVTDTLPAGVVAVEAGDVQVTTIGGATGIGAGGLWDCSGAGGGPVEGASVVTCTSDPVNLPHLPLPEAIVTNGEGAGLIAHIGIAVRAQTGMPGKLVNHVSVSGGGGGVASTESAIVVDASPASAYGVQSVDGWASNADGTLDTQAGSHPYAVFFGFDLNSKLTAQGGIVQAGGNTRNITVSLPPGLVGNPTSVPQCKREDFNQEDCDPATEVGVVVANIFGGTPIPSHFVFPVYNVVPPPGVPAAFGFVLAGNQVFMEAAVRSGGDYGITVHVHNLQLDEGKLHVVGARVILWGEPADPSHNEDRTSKAWDGSACNTAARDARSLPPGCVSEAPDVPFLTLAGSCGGPVATGLAVSTWETGESGVASFLSHDANLNDAGLAGCDHLRFGASVSVQPDTSDADTPAGLSVEVHVPQEGLVTPGALATSDIKGTTVVLPAGVVINPGQAAGLQACVPGDVPGGDGLPLPGENGEEERFDGPASCPDAAKVGEDEIETPLLSKALKGNVYILQSNPPHLKLLVAASGEGVNLKLVGDVELCETTGQVINGKACEAPGQLVTTFNETPALPFTDFKLSFSGGAQAALDTPTQCGTYTTTSDFTPWSAPAVGEVFPSSSFVIDAGPGGGACPGGSLGFSPFMIAGSTSDQAGAVTNFSLLLQRGDDQQRIEKLAFEQPAGLGGVLTGIPLCDETDANAGTCPASSQIGHAVVASGPGPYPLVLPQPGAPELPIYLTGPYKGAPFGLSIVTPVVAGPFNLGTVITRAKIEIDPRTVQISVITDPLPQQVDGVPTDLRTIQSVITRPGFLYNPTNCEPQAFTGTATSTGGTTTGLSSPFDVGSCRSLEFHPKLTAATGKQASKANGAGVVFKLTYPKAPLGSQSWLKEVKFDLPKQLPARLTTIQKACLAHVFETNRAACPAASIIGHAVVRTQVLPVPLEGPIYFVSYGSAKFPEAVLVLKGDGVTLEEHGETFINSKTGVTSATFKQVPDAPFETVEVNIPTGPYSEFGTNIPPKDHYNLCGQKLVMPTLFKAQNGLQTTQNTPITITGCPTPHKTKKAKKASHHKHSNNKHG